METSSAVPNTAVAVGPAQSCPGKQQSPLLVFISSNTHVSRRVVVGCVSHRAQWTAIESSRMVSSPTAETRAGPNMVTIAATGHVAENHSGHHHCVTMKAWHIPPLASCWHAGCHTISTQLCICCFTNLSWVINRGAK